VEVTDIKVNVLNKDAAVVSVAALLRMASTRRRKANRLILAVNTALSILLPDALENGS